MLSCVIITVSSFVILGLVIGYGGTTTTGYEIILACGFIDLALNFWALWTVYVFDQELLEEEFRKHTEFNNPLANKASVPPGPGQSTIVNIHL